MSQKTLPPVDEQRIEATFIDLGKMEVHLDPDPMEYGPGRLRKKVAEARGLLTKCERIYLSISRDLQLYTRTHRAKQLDFDLQMQDLLANDPEVRAGRNVRDRDALATMKLRDERMEIMGMEIAIQDLDAVMKVVKAKRADLRDIQGRIRDQKSLCEQEIGLGRHWGAKIPPGVTAPDLDNAPRTDKNALQQVQDLLIEDAAEVDLMPGDESWMEPDGKSDGELAVEDLLKSDSDDEPGGEPDDAEEPIDDESDDESDDDADIDDILNLVAEAEKDETPVEGDEEAAAAAAADDSDDSDDDDSDIDLDDLINDSDDGPLHYSSATSHCEGGRNDVGDWSRVTCPDCLKSAPSKLAVAKAELADVNADGGADIDVDNLLEAPSEVSESAAKAMPSVTTDEDVDDLFRRLTVDPPKTKAKTKKGELPPPLDDNMDDLIDLFS